MLHFYLSPHWSSTHRAALWFFPLVSAYAALIMPLTLYSFVYPDGLPGLADRTGHAYEMFFGIGLGLVAGYLLGVQKRSFMVILLVGWGASRVTHLWYPFSWWSLGCQAVFVLTLLWRIVPKLRVAKKWRNRILVPLMVMLGLLPLIAVVAAQLSDVWTQHNRLAGSSVLLFALLMVYMGGRAIAPAAAGAHMERGRDLQARVQPRFEGALILLLGGTALVQPWVRPELVGILVTLAGVLVLVRLARWRLGSLWGRADLLCLGVGYGWLGLGLLMFGATRLLHWPSTAVLHMITVGALGTLSTGMMARVVLRRTLGLPPPPVGLVLITVCLAVATLSRCAADVHWLLSRADWLRVSVAAWSTAYAGLTVWLFMAVLYGGKSSNHGVRL